MRTLLVALLSLLPIPALAEITFHALLNLADYTPDPERTYVIQNMPPPTNQQGLAICYAHTAATIVNYHNCQLMNLDCTTLPAKDLASPLDIARFGQEPDGDSTDVSSYRGISEGGPDLFTLEIAALHVGNAASQACFNEEMVFGELNAPDVSDEKIIMKQRERIATLTDIYNTYQGNKCTDCDRSSTAISAITKLYPKQDPARILRALEEETYPKFFDRLFTPRECARAKNRFYFEGKYSYEIALYPGDASKPSYTNMMKKIKEIVRLNSPVVISVCFFDTQGKKCPVESTHSLVLYGYSQVCKENVCLDALKVRNSWGPAWEKSNGENWFDAKRIFDSMRHSEQSIGWLRPLPATGPEPEATVADM
ncbi:hypothetical protein P2Q70_01205 [Pseudomonas mendocina]|uniref:hypothetical protein n=1 Tax=Ectopseudomonas mendocina TaxID=300 RepID=UPI0023DC5AB8|nr:hypothetical protein [Pseudomonas mendocina]MDF2073192.1 hypothetical protein [Pseudomonas mendocina]